MTGTARPASAGARAGCRIDRLHARIAALTSAALHGLLLLLAFLAPPVNVTDPQGSAGGSPMVVEVVGLTPPQPDQAALAVPPPASQAAQAPPAASRVQSTPVERADEPTPPPADAASDAPAPRPVPRPAPPRPPSPAPPAPPASPPPSTQQRQHVWGQPPGMLPEDHAPVHAGRAPSPATDRGRSRAASSAGPNLEVGGYQVYYDQRSETRLRAWHEEGMTELFLPLPGTRQYMVCPLEVALNRESGNCRMMEPDDPELAEIGDAREVINMQRVFRHGEPLWRGPRPYR